jgi:hypothetical protein
LKGWKKGVIFSEQPNALGRPRQEPAYKPFVLNLGGDCAGPGPTDRVELNLHGDRGYVGKFEKPLPLISPVPVTAFSSVFPRTV